MLLEVQPRVVLQPACPEAMTHGGPLVKLPLATEAAFTVSVRVADVVDPPGPVQVTRCVYVPALIGPVL